LSELTSAKNGEWVARGAPRRLSTHVLLYQIVVPPALGVLFYIKIGPVLNSTYGLTVSPYVYGLVGGVAFFLWLVLLLPRILRISEPTRIRVSTEGIELEISRFGRPPTITSLPWPSLTKPPSAGRDGSAVLRLPAPAWTTVFLSPAEFRAVMAHPSRPLEWSGYIPEKQASRTV
jgi:hypothetical protein